MEVIKINGGHRFQLNNKPQQLIKKIPKTSIVGLSINNFPHVKPKILVKLGERVELGQSILFDKKNPRIKFVSPAGGTIHNICYGARRSLKHIEISIDKKNDEKCINFGKINLDLSNDTKKIEITNKLIESGIWQNLKLYPGLGYAPAPGIFDFFGQEKKNKIKKVYISAINTEPGLPYAKQILLGNEEDFTNGVKSLILLGNEVVIFTDKKSKIPGILYDLNNCSIKVIEDRYPAENLKVQIKYTNDINQNDTIIGVDTETTIDIGYLSRTGYKRVERIYSISGNGTNLSYHAKSRIGISVSDFSVEKNKEMRYISGGLLTGKKINFDYFFSANDSALMILKEDRERIPFVFFRLGLNALTVFKVWASQFYKNKKFDISTSTNGEERACIQCGKCIDICPVGLLPNFLLKSSIDEDLENMEKYGIQDCAECSLCTFVCPSKIEIAQKIEDGKNLILREG